MQKWSEPNYMDPKIITMIRHGYYETLPEERTFLFQHYFFTDYEIVTNLVESKCIPLEYDPKTKSFRFLTECINKTDKVEFLKWREAFLETYFDRYGNDDEDNSYESTIFSEDDYEDLNELIDELENLEPEVQALVAKERAEFDNRKPLPLPKIDYRVSNIIYARDMVEWLIWEKEELPDQYGWIENRKNEFQKLLGKYCDKYRLPRLPLSFEPFLHLVAPEEEVENFLNLAADREEELITLTNEEEVREKAATESPIQQENNLRDIELDCVERWNEDNKEMNFPSAVGQYTIEMALSIYKNTESIVVDPVTDNLDKFIEYKAPPKSDKNDFLLN